MLEPSAILFDVGNTLLQEQRFDLEAGILAAIPEHGERVPHLARRFTDELRDKHAMHHDLLLSQWLVTNVPALADRAVDEVEDVVWAAVVTLTPTPGVEAVLARLRESDTALAAVSNASFSSRVIVRELNRHGLGELLRFVLTSGDLGWRKPATAIFHEALTLLRVSADRTWFVGDNFDEDMCGARDAGLTPIWFAGDRASIGADAPVCVRDWTEFTTIYRGAATASAAIPE